jgi:two-component system, OmpR family, response regulator ChvI
LVKGNNARRRILIVDDEPDVTLTLKTVLENNGYTVDVFNDPIIALRNFKKALEDTTANEKEKEKHRYSLVLTDIRMPNMNGFELYQKIRELDENIKVRFLTASEINHDEFKEK